MVASLVRQEGLEVVVSAKVVSQVLDALVVRLKLLRCRQPGCKRYMQRKPDWKVKWRCTESLQSMSRWRTRQRNSRSTRYVGGDWLGRNQQKVQETSAKKGQAQETMAAEVEVCENWWIKLRYVREVRQQPLAPWRTTRFVVQKKMVNAYSERSPKVGGRLYLIIVVVGN